MAGITSLLVARGQRNTAVRHVVLRSFDQIVALFSADLVSYWKFQNTGTDEQGVANATITGFPEPSVPTIVKSDMVATGALVDGTCIAWPGTAPEHAQAAHNTAHKTAQGTIVVYFQRDATTPKSQLIEADAAGAVGGMAMGINTNGAPDAYIRDSSGTPVILTGGFSDVLLDRAYAVIFKWGAPGMSLALWNDAGALVRGSTNLSTIGLSGTSTIRFGATHATPPTNNHNGPYGRVVWLDRRITDEEEALFAQALTIPRSAGAYRTVELGLSPIALWGLGEATGTTLLDAIGTNHGTYAGTVVHNALDLPTNQADGAVDFAGTGSGSIPHVAAFAVPAFTVSCWFKATSIPAAPAGPAMCIIAKTGNGAPNLPGDFSIHLVMGNGSVLRTRFRDATPVPGSVDIDTPVGTIVAGQTYHVCVRASNTGFELFLDGLRIGQNGGYTGAWSVNTQPLTVAGAASFTSLSNIIVDEVAFFNRLLTVAEIFQLAQKVGVVMQANDFNVTVSELETTAIDILANVDNLLGIPSIVIIAPPAPDTANVVAAAGLARAFVNYVAGDVAVTTARSFSYQVVNSNGTSNEGTVSVSVTPDLGAPANANCYPAIAGAVITRPVATMTALQFEINNAAAGTHILMAAGNYSGVLNINRQGNAADPIVIRPAAGVIIGTNSPVATGTWTFDDASAWVTVVGVDFNPGQVNWSGSHNRLDRCEFHNWTGNAIIHIRAIDCRISRCEFHHPNPATSGAANSFVQRCFSGAGGNFGTAALRGKRNLIDLCHVHDFAINPGLGTNNQELFSISGVEENYKLDADVIGYELYVVENCLFTGWTTNENEAWSFKFSAARMQGCTFDACDGWLVTRLASNVKIISCWFEDSTNNGGAGVGLHGDGHWVVNCHFLRSDLAVEAGNITWDDPIASRPLPFWATSRNCQIVGNTFQTGTIQLGPIGATPDPFDVACITNVFWNNTNLIGGTPATITQGPHAGTFTTNINPSLGTFPAAVKLTPADVGLNATDPYCG